MAFAAPDLTGQSIMLVAPQTIEASLIARRLQRWGAQTCVISELPVAHALLPERTWHAVLIDRAIGVEAAEALGQAARTHADSASSCSRRPRGTNFNYHRPHPPPSPATW